MPAAMTATRRCCSARRATSRDAAISTAPCISSSSRPRRACGGAEAMVKDGLFDEFPCDAIFGMHNRPGLAVGKFADPRRRDDGRRRLFRHRDHRQGRARRAARGRHRPGDRRQPDHHGAADRSCRATCGRSIPVVVSVTQIHAGDAYNVIPRARRAARHRARLQPGHDGADRGAHARRSPRASPPGSARTAEPRFPLSVPAAGQRRRRGPVHRRLRRRHRRRGQRQPRRAGTMASEDFSYMLEQVPGAYIQIGNGDGEGGCEVHNPGYDFNDEALPLGATLFARLVERRLARLGRDEAGAARRRELAARREIPAFRGLGGFSARSRRSAPAALQPADPASTPRPRRRLRGLAGPARADAGRDRRAADRQHVAAQPRRAVDRARASAPYRCFSRSTRLSRGSGWAPAAQ